MVPGEGGTNSVNASRTDPDPASPSLGTSVTPDATERPDRDAHVQNDEKKEPGACPVRPSHPVRAVTNILKPPIGIQSD